MPAGLIDRRRAGLVGAAALGGAIGLITVRSPLLAAALLFAVVLSVVIVTRPDLLLLVMVAAFPWEHKLNFPSETLSLIKGIGAVVMLSYLAQLGGNRRTLIRLSPMLGVVALLGLWIGLSLLVAPITSVSISKLLRYVLFFLFFFLVVQLVQDRAGIRRALRWFTLSVAASGVYALWLFLVVHTDYRASGPVEDPNDFAYLLGCTLPLAAYLIAHDRRLRALWIGCFVLIAATMLATFSRGALVGIGALLAWAVLTRRVPLWVLAAGVTTAVLVAALAFTVWRPLLDTAFEQKAHIAQNNTASREALWTAALKLTAREPLTGVGPGRYPEEALPLLQNNQIFLAAPVTHNSYLEILSEDGIPALLLFIAYLAGAWTLLRRVQRRAARHDDTDERRLATALQASFVIAIVSATFLSEQLTSPFWLLGGLAVVLARPAAAFVPGPAAAEEPTHRPGRDARARRPRIRLSGA
jgi:putative inorganic carbon (HCO3(-)) transporter